MKLDKKNTAFILGFIFLAFVGFYFLNMKNNMTKTNEVADVKSEEKKVDNENYVKSNVVDQKIAKSEVSDAAFDDKYKKGYGVFLGLEDVSGIKGYKIAVVDAYYLDKAKIKALHKNNFKVYTYLNIGTLENFRDAYDDFKDYAFDNYEDWPEEYWMDVSLPSWNEYLQEKARKYTAMGVDGFFLDNTDVYAEYPRDEIYDGLITIINGLNENELPLVINGGDVFVKKGINAGELKIDGVNQETIFSAINFDNNTLGKSTEEDEAYYKEYVSFCRDKCLKVFLLEYTTDDEIKEEIKNYCEENNFMYYISSTIELTGE